MLFHIKKAFSSNTMPQLFLNIYSQCGIEGASSHSGRRSLLTKLASKGVGVRVLAEIAGHAGIGVVQKYIEASDDQIRAAAELY